MAEILVTFVVGCEVPWVDDSDEAGLLGLCESMGDGEEGRYMGKRCVCVDARVISWEPRQVEMTVRLLDEQA